MKSCTASSGGLRMKKWNYQTHQYDDYSVPEDWKVSMYETDMDKQINCAECGKPMK